MRSAESLADQRFRANRTRIQIPCGVRKCARLGSSVAQLNSGRPASTDRVIVTCLGTILALVMNQVLEGLAMTDENNSAQRLSELGPIS